MPEDTCSQGAVHNWYSQTQHFEQHNNKTNKTYHESIIYFHYLLYMESAILRTAADPDGDSGARVSVFD